MPICKYRPRGEIVRVYLNCPGGIIPATADKDALWAAYKVSGLHVDPGWEQFRWDTPEDEAADKAKFFSGWDDPKCWEGPTNVFFDALY